MPQSFPFNTKSAFTDGPFNPFADEKNHEVRGNPNDSVAYISEPGVNFFRPWLSVPGGAAFVWPLGVEGFSHSLDPQLGIHKYIGDNAVKVDVIHNGEERLTLSGSFPGMSSIGAFRALRDIVLADTPARGKVLYVPHLFTYTQRVAVGTTHFDHAETDRGTDLTYSIEFVRLGAAARVHEDDLVDVEPQPTVPPATAGAKGGSGAGAHRPFRVNGTYNTLRKIAAHKLGKADKWRALYDKNSRWFIMHNVPAFRAPNHRLPLGTTIYY